MAALIAAVLGTGCASLQRIEEPRQFLERSSPSEVYVTFKNHSKVTLTQPRVSGDSLVGTLAGVSEPVAAPFSDIERVETMQRDRARTRWLIAGLGIATVGLVFGLANSGEAGFMHPCNRQSTDDCDYSEYRLGRD